MTARVIRSQERKNRRLKVRFGIEAPERMAFVGNASPAGIHIITGQPERVGTLLQLCIYLPDEQEILVQGKVRWAKKIPPNLIRLSKSAGMGVKFTNFTSGRESYEDYLTSLRH